MLFNLLKKISKIKYILSVSIIIILVYLIISFINNKIYILEIYLNKIQFNKNDIKFFYNIYLITII